MRPTRPPSLVDELHDLRRRLTALERYNALRTTGKLLATVTLAADETGLTADGAISGFSVDATLTTGRRYAIHLEAHVSATSAGGNVGINTMDDGARIQIARLDLTNTGRVQTASSVCYLDGDGASHTIRADIDVITAGTYTVASSSTNPSMILIIDIGPTPS